MDLKNILISETDDFADIKVNLGYLDDFNYNGIILSSENDPDKSVQSLVNTPVVAYYNKFNDDFEGHNVQMTSEGVKFGTQAIGNHTKAWIEKASVKPVFSNEEIELPCMFAEARIYKSRYPNAYNVIKNRLLANKMFTSWELKPKTLESVSVSDSRIPNPRKATEWTMLGNALLGSRLENGKLVDITPAYGNNSKVLVMSEKQEMDIDLELAEALSKDIIVSESIIIDNSKESSVDGVWSNPESRLYKPLLESDNKIALVNEAYLIVGDNYENSPSTELKYPHHVIRDNKLVVHVRGVVSAYARLRSQGFNSGEEIDHIKKHYNELELQTDLFEKSITHLMDWITKNEDMDDDKWFENMLEHIKKIEREEFIMEERIKELEAIIEKLNNELEMYKQKDMEDEMSKAKEEMSKIKAEKDEIEKNLAEMSEAFKELTKSKESLEAEISELKVFEAKVKELEQAENERILSEKKNELKEFAMKDGFIKQEELESNEDIKTIISELTLENFESAQSKILIIQGKIAMDLVKAQKKEELETSELNKLKVIPNANLNNDDGTLDAASIIKKAYGIQ